MSQGELEDKTVIKVPVTSSTDDAAKGFKDLKVALLEQEYADMVYDSDFNLAPESRGSGDCGAQMAGLNIGDKGTIETPNYPQDYPPDIQCIWWLKVLQGVQFKT